MAFSSLNESVKETNDKAAGFLTGRLIVDLNNQSIELEQLKSWKTNYIPLTEKCQIEVRNGSEYRIVSFEEILETLDYLVGCSLYAGTYARVKPQHKEKEYQFPDLDKMSDIEAIRWYTGEVARLGKDRDHDKEYGKQLFEWKKKMNKRLKENKKMMWER